MDPVFDLEISLGMIVLILQFCVVIPILLAYRLWSRSRGDGSE
jgi:hypothetical protein